MVDVTDSTLRSRWTSLLRAYLTFIYICSNIPRIGLRSSILVFIRTHFLTFTIRIGAGAASRYIFPNVICSSSCFVDLLPSKFDINFHTEANYYIGRWFLYAIKWDELPGFFQVAMLSATRCSFVVKSLIQFSVSINAVWSANLAIVQCVVFGIMNIKKIKKTCPRTHPWDIPGMRNFVVLDTTWKTVYMNQEESILIYV